MNPITAITERPNNTATHRDIHPDTVDIVRMTLGQYLKKHRADKTMKEVAEEIGCDLSYLSKIENDRVTPPWDMIERLADCYDIPEDSLPALAWKQLDASRQGQLNLAIAFLSLVS